MTLMELIEQRRRLSRIVLARLAESEPDCLYCGEPECYASVLGGDNEWSRAFTREVLPTYEPTLEPTYEPLMWVRNEWREPILRG